MLNKYINRLISEAIERKFFKITGYFCEDNQNASFVLRNKNNELRDGLIMLNNRIASLEDYLKLEYVHEESSIINRHVKKGNKK